MKLTIWYKCYKSALAVFLFLVSYAARGEDAWTDAAIQALSAMNSGKGDFFVQVTHVEHKMRLRQFMIQRMRASPGSEDTKAALRDYGVASVTELEALPVDKMVAKTIYAMHYSVPDPMRTALRNAKFVSAGSELNGDQYRVHIDMFFTRNGESQTRKLVVLSKQENGVWKYFGEEQHK